MQKFIRWFGVGALAIVALVLIAAGYLYWKSNSILNETYAAAELSLDLPPADSTALARGRHLTLTRGCVECHGADLAGQVIMDAMPMAYIPSTNLTPGGVGATYTDADWIRAIRHGVRPDGKSLWIMPSMAYTRLSPSDLASLIAYLKSVPPVQKSFPPKQFGPIGRMLIARGELKPAASTVNHDLPFSAAPPKGPTAEYGEYIVYMCRHCHGTNLNGGIIEGPPGAPPTANLTQAPDALGRYTERDFFRALREGKKPEGTQMDPQFMPWTVTSAMTDTEIQAIWAYLQTVDPLPTGGVDG